MGLNDIITTIGIVLFIIFVTTIVILCINTRKEENEKILNEYLKISPGDIYECKNDVNSKGVSSTNPFIQYKYQVIRKKDGWVELKSLDNNSIHQISVKELMKKHYKCINRNKYQK